MGWEENESAKLPSQEQLLAYLDEVEAKLAGWFAATDLLSPEQVFPYTGPTALDRAIYTLRHTQQHVGEMNLELTRRGFQGPDWR